MMNPDCDRPEMVFVARRSAVAQDTPRSMHLAGFSISYVKKNNIRKSIQSNHKLDSYSRIFRLQQHRFRPL
jgi:hypothetical protein